MTLPFVGDRAGHLLDITSPADPDIRRFWTYIIILIVVLFVAGNYDRVP